MQNLIKLIAVLFCLYPLVGTAQIEFFKNYTNNGYDFGQGVVQLEDSSYVITGSSSSFQDGAAQAFLLKIDSLGNHVWAHDYGGIETDWGRRVLYKKNVGFFIAGYTNSMGNGGYDAYLIKTDEQGTKLWEKTFGKEGWEKINDAVMLADTSIIMVGQTDSGTSGNDDMYIVRTDQNGDTLWTKQIGTSGEDLLTSIRILSDTSCLIAGQKYIADSLLNKAYMIALKNDGTILWEKYYGNNGTYCFNDICIVGSEINAVGHREGLYSGTDYYVVKILPDGSQSYEFCYNTLDYDAADLVTSYGSSGKLYIGYSYENSTTFPVGKDFYIGRFQGNLNFDNFSFPLANVGDDIGGQLISTSDGGAIVVGYNTSFGSGGNNVFAAKIGPNDLYPQGNPTVNTLVGLHEISNENTSIYKVYPNPVSDMITIEFPESFSGRIEIQTMLGQVIWSQKQNFDSKMQIDLKQFQKGNYFISITNEKGEKCTKRIVVN